MDIAFSLYLENIIFNIYIFICIFVYWIFLNVLVRWEFNCIGLYYFENGIVVRVFCREILSEGFF